MDEYLKLRAHQQRDATATASTSAPGSASAPSRTASLSGADRRAAQKEVSSIDRRLERLQKDLDALDAQFVDAHDDFARILDLQAKRDAVTDEVAALEERWLELSDLID